VPTRSEPFQPVAQSRSGENRQPFTISASGSRRRRHADGAGRAHARSGPMSHPPAPARPEGDRVAESERAQPRRRSGDPWRDPVRHPFTWGRPRDNRAELRADARLRNMLSTP